MTECPPRRALLIAVLAFAGCWMALTAVWGLMALRPDAGPPGWASYWHTDAAVRVAERGPLALYDGSGYPYLPLPAMLDSLTVAAGKAVFGHPAVAWGGMTLWAYAYVLWASSVSVGVLAYAAARRIDVRAVAPVAVAAIASAGILGWAHFEDVLLAAALIAACSGSRIGGAASLLLKQTAAALALPFLWANRRDPRFLLAVIGGAALVLAPFVLATPGEFSDGVLFASNTSPSPDEVGAPRVFTVRGLVPWPSFTVGRAAWIAAAVVFRCWYADWWPMAWHFPELPGWPSWDTASGWQAALWWTVALPLVLMPAALAARGAATPATRPRAQR